MKRGNAYLQVAVYLKKMSFPYFGYKVKQLAKLDRISGMSFMNAYKLTELHDKKLNSQCSFYRIRKHSLTETYYI